MLENTFANHDKCMDQDIIVQESKGYIDFEKFYSTRLMPT